MVKNYGFYVQKFQDPMNFKCGKGHSIELTHNVSLMHLGKSKIMSSYRWCSLLTSKVFHPFKPENLEDLDPNCLKVDNLKVDIG